MLCKLAFFCIRNFAQIIKHFAAKFIFLSLSILILPVFAIAQTQKTRLNVPAQQQVQLAIIIDDLGYKLREGVQAIALPDSVTLSIIPFSPHGKTLAELAYSSDREIMLHLPMSPILKKSWEKGLTNEMNRGDLDNTVAKMLSHIPHVSGVNNHGGSLFTQNREKMSWLLETLKKQNIFFIDSRTTPKTVAAEVAREVEIPYNSRDVFLDNVIDERAIIKQLDKLVTIAINQGQAIGIGHPHEETLNVLSNYLPTLKSKGVKIVKASTLLIKFENTLTQQSHDVSTTAFDLVEYGDSKFINQKEQKLRR